MRHLLLALMLCTVALAQEANPTYYIKFENTSAELKKLLMKNLTRKSCYSLSDIQVDESAGKQDGPCHAFRAYQSDKEIVGLHYLVEVKALDKVSAPERRFSIRFLRKGAKGLEPYLNPGEFRITEREDEMAMQSLSATILALTFK